MTRNGLPSLTADQRRKLLEDLAALPRTPKGRIRRGELAAMAERWGLSVPWLSVLAHTAVPGRSS